MSEIQDVPYVTTLEARRKIRMSDEGAGAKKPTTVVEAFAKTVKNNSDSIALSSPVGACESWTHTTWSEYNELVKKAARSMLALGLERYHGVCVLGFNSLEWFVSELACMHAGGVLAGIYTTNNAEACRYVLENCDANICVVEDTIQLEKIQSVWDKLPMLKAIVQYKGKVEKPADNVYDWEQFMALSEKKTDADVEAITKTITPENCAALIYTSGTTGNPKGVMVSHDNLTWTASVIGEDVIGMKNDDVLISYLPLSHVAAQMVDLVLPSMTGARVYFATPNALKGGLLPCLQAARPTVFIGVPRVWEKIQETMKFKGSQRGAISQMIGRWAKSKGLEKGKSDQTSSPYTPWGYGVAKHIVFDKVRALLGLDRCHHMFTAAAPIAMSTLDYFLSLNMPLLEIYGASETTGPVVVSYEGHYRHGQAGPPFPGCECVIDNPNEKGDGEITSRGRHIFMGYLKNEEASKKTINKEGFYASGDIGRMTDGFLAITGRIKEILITAGGENVAPILIEEAIKDALPFISQAVVIGDKRKFLSVLLTIKVDINEDGSPTDNISEAALAHINAIDSSVKTVADLKSSNAVQTAIQAGIEEANTKAISKAQKVQKFTILDKDLSIGGGEMTATMKIKRPIVYKNHAETIESMY